MDSVNHCGTMYERSIYENSGSPSYPSTQRVGRFLNFLRSDETPFIVGFCEEPVPFTSITGVDEASTEVVFHIYQIPVEDLVELSFENGITPVRILVYDLLGNLVILPIQE